MTRELYDSTSVEDIPRSAKMVAGYVDGRYRTVPALLERFPHAIVVSITVLGSPGAHVCDTEPGNIGIDAAAQWAANEVKAGRHPTLYCMASQWPQVKGAVNARGVKGKVSYWVASYDGKAVIPRGAVAKQYLHGDKSHPGSYSGGHYDTSVVADHWPGVDPDPKPPKDHPVSRRHRRWARKLTVAFGQRTHPVTAEDRKTLAALDSAVLHALGRKP